MQKPIYSSLYVPGIDSYPSNVKNQSDQPIGVANDQYEFVEIWNKDASNKRVGKLYPYTEFEFKLISLYYNPCCACPFPSPGSGNSSGGGGGGAEAHLPYIVVYPPVGTSSYTLPPEWSEKRIKVYRNGFFYTSWSRTVDGFKLTIPGDVFSGTEEVVIENY